MAVIYHSEWENTPMVRTERGTWTNHRRLPNGEIGERITRDEATHIGRWRYEIVTKE